VEFVSAPRLLCAAAKAAGVSEAAAGDLLHTVFGLSKDFCMSGMRVGWVHSRNETLHKVTSLLRVLLLLLLLLLVVLLPSASKDFYMSGTRVGCV
jgi:aspartate/methionine/tyrosine aminotransferase